MLSPVKRVGSGASRGGPVPPTGLNKEPRDAEDPGPSTLSTPSCHLGTRVSCGRYLPPAGPFPSRADPFPATLPRDSQRAESKRGGHSISGPGTPRVGPLTPPPWSPQGRLLHPLSRPSFLRSSADPPPSRTEGRFFYPSAPGSQVPTLFPAERGVLRLRDLSRFLPRVLVLNVPPARVVPLWGARGTGRGEGHGGGGEGEGAGL